MPPNAVSLLPVFEQEINKRENSRTLPLDKCHHLMICFTVESFFSDCYNSSSQVESQAT